MDIPFEALAEQLESLVGLKAVKAQVRDLIAFNELQKKRVQLGLKKTNKTLHMAFLGNPGTAKTTVARIVGRMYKSLGILSKGHFIEAGRADLIAEYQGQTAIKVRRLINKARGGVLFIDEAYSITENEHSDSYGRECLTELTKALEDYRDDLVVIVAGYPDLMKQFFASNPGLKSRFNQFITFPDYSEAELLDIFKYLCKQNDYIVTEEGLVKLKEKIAKDFAATSSSIKVDHKEYGFSPENKDNAFSPEHKGNAFSPENKAQELSLKDRERGILTKANGRYIRNLFDDVTMNQAKRLYNRKEALDKQSLMLLCELDF
ncbi:AAA family ATPase [uncultured Veillonella sp.]|uniref:AAA family ATPase n=1 Tax=uncultured Veillonella sp. TaxID=159268 RepID=UPI00261F71EC|nr:AAA family ATPase [uncultured Veillonella sp.]